MSATQTQTEILDSEQLLEQKKLSFASNGHTYYSHGSAIDLTTRGSDCAHDCKITVYVHHEIAHILRRGPYTLRVALLGEEGVKPGYDRSLSKPGQDYPYLSEKCRHYGGVEHYSVELPFRLTLGDEPRYWIEHKPDGSKGATYPRIGFGQVDEVGSDGSAKIIEDRPVKFPYTRTVGFSNKVIARPRMYRSKTDIRPHDPLNPLLEEDWIPGDGFIRLPEPTEKVQIWFERDPVVTASGFAWAQQSYKCAVELSLNHRDAKMYMKADGNWSSVEPHYKG